MNDDNLSPETQAEVHRILNTPRRGPRSREESMRRLLEEAPPTEKEIEIRRALAATLDLQDELDGQA